jgi:hypothetical protein
MPLRRRPGRTSSAGSALGRTAIVGLGLTVCVASLAGCDLESEDPSEDSAAEDYLSELAAACTTARGALAALPQPPEEISPDDFAIEVARVLEAEAEAVRGIRPPEELDDDHRAFVRNTDEQADAWRLVAETVDADLEAVDEIRTQILELSLGRDDLAVEMGAEACSRSER